MGQLAERGRGEGAIGKGTIVSAARIATTLEETRIFPDVREAFGRACEITGHTRAQLLRIAVGAWLTQWEAAGSPSSYLGYAQDARQPEFLCPGDGAAWNPKVATAYTRRGSADVVAFRPRLVPKTEGAGA
jgi:hypothetical protein